MKRSQLIVLVLAASLAPGATLSQTPTERAAVRERRDSVSERAREAWQRGAGELRQSALTVSPGEFLRMSYATLTSGFSLGAGTRTVNQLEINGVPAVCAPLSAACVVWRSYTVPCQCSAPGGGTVTRHASCTEKRDPITGESCGKYCQSCYYVCGGP